MRAAFHAEDTREAAGAALPMAGGTPTGEGPPMAGGESPGIPGVPPGTSGAATHT